MVTSIDIGNEAYLINTFMQNLWKNWPEVETAFTVDGERGITKAQPRETSHKDLVYDCFPFLFVPDFPTVKLDDLRILAKASRLYSLHAFLCDTIIDTQGLKRADALMRSNVLLSESMHLLYQLFPSQSSFWQQFQQIMHTYLGAIRLEQQWRQQPIREFHLPTAEHIAEGKSALSKAAIIGLAILSGSSECQSVLVQSVEKANIGFQFYDDLRDWKEDLITGQPSLILAELFREMNYTSILLATDERSAMIPQMKQCLYTSDLARAAADRAASYFQQAQSVLDTLPQNSQESGQQITWRRLLRDAYRAVTELEKDLHRQSKNTTFLQRTSQVSHLDGTLDNALDYILQQQGSEGEWGDFLFSIGHSTDWVTGYVGQSLMPFLTRCGSHLEKASQWLLSTFNKDGWGYNIRAPRDSDSTANSVLFLVHLSQMLDVSQPLYQAIMTTLTRAFAKLATYQHNNGGFSTYTRKDREGGFDIVQQFWLTPHLEITATCGRCFLLSTGHVTDRVRDSLNFLLLNQDPQGTWPAYWYDGPFYGTAQVLHFISKAIQSGWMDSRIKACVQRALQAVMSQQRDDGGWALYDDQPPQAVATAVAMQVIIASMEILSSQDMFAPSIKAALQHGCLWLHQHQQNDGSWLPSYLLRVPLPECEKPWLERFPHSSKGDLQHVTIDQQRIFTTVTVIQTFAMLQRHLSIWQTIHETIRNL